VSVAIVSIVRFASAVVMTEKLLCTPGADS
jgi:hypothetical protein